MSVHRSQLLIVPVIFNDRGAGLTMRPPRRVAILQAWPHGRDQALKAALSRDRRHRIQYPGG